MGMPTSMTPPDPFTLTQDFGGAPSVTIQDSPGMGLDIDQGIPIIIPVQAITPADPLLVPAGQVRVLRLQRMRRHNFSSERTRGDKVQQWPFIDTFSKPMLASPLRAG